MITLFHTYYNQRAMLTFHKAAWNQHTQDINYTLVDDASPNPINDFSYKRLSIVRVKQDIPWNMAGARNLGFFVAETEWVLCADIDHVVSAYALNQILSLDLTDPNVVYTFGRKDETGKIGCKAIINILMNKKRYFEIGGYDEDFSGNYGREETFFYHCLRYNSTKLIHCDQIILDWHPKRGATRGLVRDKEINAKVFEDKMNALKRGAYKNGPILKFQWEVVQSV
jgi:hypothetical protein